MIKSNRLLLVAVLILSLAGTTRTELLMCTPGRSERGGLSGDQHVTYGVALERDQFLFVRIMQLSVDIVVSVRAPDGRLLVNADQLTSGPEFVSLVSDSSGIYQIDLHPFDPQAQQGSYVLKVLKLRPTASDPIGRIDQLFAEFDSNSTPGAVAVVVRDGQVMCTGAYGLADLENNKPLTPQTPINICSIGKQLTAFAIALLADSGELNLDEDIHTYLPWLPYFGAKITVRHLIHHTSGLRELNDLALISRCADRPIRREDFYTLIKGQKDLNFPPGTRYLYSNTNYILLADIIEHLTGESFINWMEKNVLKPLGMNSTFFCYNWDTLETEIAWPYQVGSTGQYERSKLLPVWYVGAGNVYASAEDIGRWLVHLEHPKICSPRVIELMSQGGKLENGDTVSYAFAQDRQSYRGLNVLEHGGGGWGYGSYVMRFPEQHFAVLVATNFVYGRAFTHARNVADLFLEKNYTAPRPDDEYVNRRYATIADSASLETLTGMYVCGSGRTVEITHKARHLFARVAGQDEVLLYPETASAFFAKETDLVFTFDPGKHPAESVNVATPSGSLSYRRLRAGESPAPQIEELAGQYVSPELGVSYSVIVRGTQASLLLPTGVEMPLSRMENDRFRGPYFTVQFDRSDQSHVVGLRICSDRALNVRFLKR